MASDETTEMAAVAPPPKEKKQKGGKKDKGAKAAATVQDSGPNVAAHPRAARSIARTKGWGGLIGFFVAGYLSLPTGTVATAGLRALIAGIVCYMACWGASVFVWRRLVILEIKGREQQLIAEVLGASPARSGAQDAP
jgi:hypothetical protein